MSAIDTYLEQARRRVNLHRAQAWSARGAAVATISAAGAELAYRRWPADPAWPPLVVVATVPAVLALVGWAWTRPTLAETARLADRHLQGQERLSTAYQLAGACGALVLRQRADAECFAEHADPRGVAPSGWPCRELAIALAAAAVAIVLGAVSNPALARLHRRQADTTLRHQAAEQVQALAHQVAQGHAGVDPGARKALVKDLTDTADALRKATSPTNAVADLTLAQEQLAALADPSTADHQVAASAAGAQLGQAAASAQAGAALSAADSRAAAADQLAKLAASLPGLPQADQAAAAQQLQATAGATTGDSLLSGLLGRAADALDAGNTAAAQVSLNAAAARQQQSDASPAATQLQKLATSLSQLRTADKAALAAALAKASSAAQSDPKLASSLNDASQALTAGNLRAAAQALDAAATEVQATDRQSQFSHDAAAASNDLQVTKNNLLEPAGAQPACRPSDGMPGMGLPGSTVPGETTVPADLMHHGCSGATGTATGAGGGSAAAAAAGAGAGVGAGAGAGQAGQGVGGGKGQNGVQTGRGPGTGHGGGTSQGLALGAVPGDANESVFVPGAFGLGATQDLPGGTGNGVNAPLVPYEQVYSDYRATALSQIDREVVPVQVRQQVNQYCQGGN